MPVFLFRGRVLPEFTELNLHPAPTIHFSEPPHPDMPQGLSGDFTIAINHSMVDLICCVEQRNADIGKVHNRAVAYLRAIVDLYCFSTGHGLSVLIDRVVGPDGIEQMLIPVNRDLAGVCTHAIANPQIPGAFGFDNKSTIDTLIRQPALFLSLRDLISAISYPGNTEVAVIDCARAVEGLRALMVPAGTSRATAWGIFQDNLNIERAYREFVTDLSTGPRHGDRTQYLSGTMIAEALLRSWTIMDRFLEFARRGNERLPLSEFPLLSG